MQRLNLSDQVVNIIKERISTGQYQSKESLPSISDLAAELGVGRSTIREALNQLETLGIVSIKHGKGVFIADTKVEYSNQVRSFSQAISDLGMKPGAVILKKEMIPADGRIAENLHIPSGEMVNHIMRLRLADSAPMAIENSYTPCRLFPRLLDQPELDKSLYDLFRTAYQKEVFSALRTIEAVSTRPDENKLLGLSNRQPALMITTIAYDQGHEHLEYGKSLYRADRYKFVVHQTC